MLRKIASVAVALAAMTVAASAEQTLVIKGSDTLGAKLVPQLKEQFRIAHPDVNFEIAAEGSSTGISAIISSTADIGMSSRPVSKQELAQAQANGVDMKSIIVAFDGIAVIVNEANPMEDLTLDQVRQIFTGQVEDWTAVGGMPGSISVYTRNTASGTYKDFQKMAMHSEDYATSSQKMAGNEQIASEVAKNPNGIGYVGLAYIDMPGVKVIRVNGSLPSRESIRAGKYPYARETFYLINANKPNPLAQQFVDFTLSDEGQKIVDAVHFVPIR
ncbi:MAG TPA: phosphate ABC transporter substrate-binding protein [Opitutales bacterium]|nr:phosphate ABC transporter substrate-binding protein [Opitutales bacterium]